MTLECGADTLPLIKTAVVTRWSWMNERGNASERFVCLQIKTAFWGCEGFVFVSADDGVIFFSFFPAS